MRQRKKMNSELKDDEALSQPLLDEVRETDNSKESKQQLIVHPGSFDLTTFLSYIFTCWQQLMGVVGSFTGGVLQVVFHVASIPELSNSQELYLEHLQMRADEAFQSDNKDHGEALHRLWVHAFPHLPCTSLKNSQWKEMGWQGEDPSTDFRGSGCLGLDCLLYMADVHNSTFLRLLGKLDGERSDWEYPFAVAGLNISFMLMEVVGLGNSRQGQHHSKISPSTLVSKSSAGKGFLGLVVQEDMAFQELFVATFEYLDREWLRQKASYMQFNQILKTVKEHVMLTLSSRPINCEALRAKLMRGP